MHYIFRLLEWGNKIGAESLILRVFAFMVGLGGVLYFIHSPTLGYFVIAIGGALSAQLYVVTIIQRKYVKRTQEKLKDIEYLPPVEEE